MYCVDLDESFAMGVFHCKHRRRYSSLSFGCGVPSPQAFFTFRSEESKTPATTTHGRIAFTFRKEGIGGLNGDDPLFIGNRKDPAAIALNLCAPGLEKPKPIAAVVCDKCDERHPPKQLPRLQIRCNCNSFSPNDGAINLVSLYFLL